MAKNNKKMIKKEIKNYIDLLYMTPSQINVKELATLLQENQGISVEVWEEMNVIEVELGNENSVDFELIDKDFKEPSDVSFVRNRNIQTIFAINMCEEDLDTVSEYFESIIAKFNGFLCADSEDFYPVYAGSSKK